MLEQVQSERIHTNENMTWEEALRASKVTVTRVNPKHWLNMWSRLVTGYNENNIYVEGYVEFNIYVNGNMLNSTYISMYISMK